MILISCKGVAAVLLGRKSRLGKRVHEIRIGEKLHLTETIEDKDLLLYLGLTNDNNPLYIQHDYASDTPFEKPIVPTIMLNGIITSAISKHMPGPGSHIREQNITFLKPVYHYETIDFLLKVERVDRAENLVDVSVRGFNNEKQPIIEGLIKVYPPY
ncbi:MaoC/PaaZ C-terminal domain-containing protein [Lysinibacillus sp. 54212]|uniref:MaoC/PaaZ C-terminal domain-containing protein n=1 Tax=Lysinibacillus sp. 54212 TaxID=3119829 RepID=UPI002FC852DD